MTASSGLLKSPIVIIEPIDTSSIEKLDKIDEQFVNVCNEMIAFINCFRYRENHISRIEGLFTREIEQRENFIRQLSDNTWQEKLIACVPSYGETIGLSAELIKQNEKTIRQIFKKFNHYARFAHLIAIELAVVSIAMEKLNLYIKLYARDIWSDDVKELIKQKCKELFSCQDSIYACMQMHMQIFEENLKNTECAQELPHNDILIVIKEKIASLVGKENMNLALEVEPDQSILFAIPALPFACENNENTAQFYFAEVIKSYEEALRNNTGVRGALNTASNLTAKCMQGAWWITTAAVSSPIWATKVVVRSTSSTLLGLWTSHPPSVAAENDEEQEAWVVVERADDRDTQINLLVQDMQDYVNSMQNMLKMQKHEIEQGSRLEEMKEQISRAIKVLEQESKSLKQCCFAFFTRHFISLKSKKIKALKQLLRAENIEDLKGIANNMMTGKGAEDILRGRHSRTKKIIDEVMACSCPEFKKHPSTL